MKAVGKRIVDEVPLIRQTKRVDPLQIVADPVPGKEGAATRAGSIGIYKMDAIIVADFSNCREEAG